MLFVSTRKRFKQGDPAWGGYAEFIGLATLREVRTLDAALNGYVDDCGDVYCEPSQVMSVLETLPKPPRDLEYYLLASQVDESPSLESFDGFEFIGCDMCDETMTSSVVSCGPWRGLLEPFVGRFNRYGLLSVADALKAKEILPKEWGPGEPHAFVSIWALFSKAL